MSGNSCDGIGHRHRFVRCSVEQRCHTTNADDASGRHRTVYVHMLSSTFCYDRDGLLLLQLMAWMIGQEENKKLLSIDWFGIYCKFMNDDDYKLFAHMATDIAEEIGYLCHYNTDDRDVRIECCHNDYTALMRTRRHRIVERFGVTLRFYPFYTDNTLMIYDEIFYF